MKKEEIANKLSEIYDAVSAIPVSGESVEKMWYVRKELRQLYKEMLQKHEYKAEGGEVSDGG